VPWQPIPPSETTVAIRTNTNNFFKLSIFSKSPFAFVSHDFDNLELIAQIAEAHSQLSKFNI